MKQLHRTDLFAWSEFDAERNLDFHSVLWVRNTGNILIDPLPMSIHDQEHLNELGGASIIIITNSDHCRASHEIAQKTGAAIYGPIAEQHQFDIACDHWLADQEAIVPGLISYQLEGSKTPGELALLLEESTLITGDLIRCHKAGELCLLPKAKLSNETAARQSVRRIASIHSIETVLPGDGWPLFNNGGTALKRLVDTFS